MFSAVVKLSEVALEASGQSGSGWISDPNVSACSNWFQKPTSSCGRHREVSRKSISSGREADRLKDADVGLDLLVEERALLARAFMVSAKAARAPAAGRSRCRRGCWSRIRPGISAGA